MFEVNKKMRVFYPYFHNLSTFQWSRFFPYFTWLSVVVTPVTTVEADLAATGEAEADVVGVVPLRGFAAVRVASFTS